MVNLATAQALAKDSFDLVNANRKKFYLLDTGERFGYQNHVWTKIGDNVAIAQGYEASNYFDDDVMVGKEVL